MADCVLNITVLAGEVEGSGERGNSEPDLKQGITVSGEEGFAGRVASVSDARCFGVVVVRRPWAAGAGKRGERRWF